MEVIGGAFEKISNIMATMSITDYVDIIIVAYIIFRIIMFIRRTNSRNLALGLIFFMIVLWLSEIFRLTMINSLMRKAVELGLIALLILFQPELRRMLEKMGSSITDGRFAATTEIESAINETVHACLDMSETRTGALIVFERNVSLNHILSTGTFVNSDTTTELIKNIFFNKAPLHDGALIIRKCRIAAAGCMLPLTQNTNLSKDLGTRHRAGIGLSEQSDAVVIIVSEETGAISVALDGKLKRHLSEEGINSILRSELVIEEGKQSKYREFLNFAKKLLLVEDGREE